MVFWLFSGAIAFGFWHPDYYPSDYVYDADNMCLSLLGWLLVGIFVFAEVMSFLCHLHFW